MITGHIPTSLQYVPAVRIIYRVWFAGYCHAQNPATAMIAMLVMTS
jgi:hypothetical protein